MLGYISQPILISSVGIAAFVTQALILCEIQYLR